MPPRTITVNTVIIATRIVEIPEPFKHTGSLWAFKGWTYTDPYGKWGNSNFDLAPVMNFCPNIYSEPQRTYTHSCDTCHPNTSSVSVDTIYQANNCGLYCASFSHVHTQYPHFNVLGLVEAHGARYDGWPIIRTQHLTIHALWLRTKRDKEYMKHARESLDRFNVPVFYNCGPKSIIKGLNKLATL